MWRNHRNQQPTINRWKVTISIRRRDGGRDVDDGDEYLAIIGDEGDIGDDEVM